MIIWYDCPKCGLEDSSDGEHFCGKCEEEYARLLKREEKMLNKYHTMDCENNMTSEEICNKFANSLERAMFNSFEELVGHNDDVPNHSAIYLSQILSGVLMARIEDAKKRFEQILLDNGAEP